jgi:hypothetical protein
MSLLPFELFDLAADYFSMGKNFLDRRIAFFLSCIIS